MTDRVEALKKAFVIDRVQRAARREPLDGQCLAPGFAAQGLPNEARAARRLVFMLEGETPALFAGERIVFTRTQPVVPALLTPPELERLKKTTTQHESIEVCNIGVDYGAFLRLGIGGMAEKVRAAKASFTGDSVKTAYLDGQLDILNALAGLTERYRAAARQADNAFAAGTLAALLRHPPQSFAQALQLQRIIHFTMWLGGNYHNTLGRFDQYMLPWLRQDLASGALTPEAALELVEEFFLTFNRDSDLYPGVQQGDNGQSMVLGGVLPQGGDGYNELSEMCLRACLELKVIDPKINLRVDKNTPTERYVLATELTRQGLGFPQYSNDDVVVPGLTALGYAPEDARDYTVAACWEFIIPGKGMEVPNIGALQFAALARQTVTEHLEGSERFEDLMARLREAIDNEAQRLCKTTDNLYIFPAPFLSLMMDGCVENARDVSLGCVYNNYGFHGTGLATAADSLAAVKHYVYDTGEVEKSALLRAMEADFEGYGELLAQLRYEGPKMGCDSPLADEMGCALLQAFAEALKGRRNDRGGVFRAGTGSAMYYLRHAENLGATPDGRRAGEGLPANYSPSLFSRCRGPVSIIKSFTKPDLSQVVNGGPLTLELHDTLFRGPDSVEKVAALVKSYTDLGGHQLQVNAVNRETLLAAQRDPAGHRGLIVRVWGWSGYFVELDKAFQDHIIQRMELLV